MTIVYDLHTAYTPKGNLKYGWLRSIPKKFLDFECKVIQNRGKSAKSYWPNDYEVEYVYKSNKKKSDLAGYSPNLILSRRGADELRDLLEPNGEFLPVHCKENSDVVLFHPPTCLDALDKEKAVVSYYDEEKKQGPWRVEWHHFIDEKIGDVPIFVLQESTSIYVTDRFVERVREKNLKGFGFRRLWSSELGCIHSEYLCGPYPDKDEDINW